MTFNEKLVKLRKLRGITQDEFASAVGVSRQAVYKWESGQSYPEVSKLMEIKVLFNISIDDLLDDSYEVILPEKKKKRLSSSQKKAIEAMVKTEEGITHDEAKSEEVFTEEPVAATVEIEAAAPVEEPIVEVSAEAPAEEKEVEKAAEDKTQKRGFFKRFFGK